MFWPAVAALSLALSVAAEEEQILQDDPCLAKSKVVGDVQYCDRYWECEFGQPELYDCPNGLVWVGKNQGIADGCDYPWRHTNICKDKDLANPPQSTEHCDWLYGIFGHETSCTRYWTCWNGTATEQFCIGGLLYNEETHACDWPQNVAGCQKHRKNHIFLVTIFSDDPISPWQRCARTTLMEMSRWANLVTDTGRARAATPGSRDAPPCSCSTRTGGAASLRPLKTVKCQQPKPLLPARTETTSPAPAPTSLNNHQTRDAAEDGDLRDLLEDNLLVEAAADRTRSLFLLIFHLAQSH